MFNNIFIQIEVDSVEEVDLYNSIFVKKIMDILTTGFGSAHPYLYR
jgi:hypothetical protein